MVYRNCQNDVFEMFCSMRGYRCYFPTKSWLIVPLQYGIKVLEFCLNYYTRAENTSRTKDAVIWIPNYWNPESRGLESGIQWIQRVGIRNPEAWNPESNTSVDSVTWGDNNAFIQYFSVLYMTRRNNTEYLIHLAVLSFFLVGKLCRAMLAFTCLFIYGQPVFFTAPRDKSLTFVAHTETSSINILRNLAC